jgi:hypothetical protein
VRRGLNAEEQTLLTLFVDRKLTSGEVAEVLSDDAETVTPAVGRQRYERLRDELRQLFAEEGLLGEEPPPRRRE